MCQSLLKGQGSLENFEDREIYVKPLGIFLLDRIKATRIQSFSSVLKMLKYT